MRKRAWGVEGGECMTRRRGVKGVRWGAMEKRGVTVDPGGYSCYTHPFSVVGAYRCEGSRKAGGAGGARGGAGGWVTTNKLYQCPLPMGCSLSIPVAPPVPRTTTVTTTLPSVSVSALSTTGWCFPSLVAKSKGRMEGLW